MTSNVLRRKTQTRDPFDFIRFIEGDPMAPPLERTASARLWPEDLELHVTELSPLDVDLEPGE